MSPLEPFPKGAHRDWLWLALLACMPLVAPACPRRSLTYLRPCVERLFDSELLAALSYPCSRPQRLLLLSRGGCSKSGLQCMKP